MNLKSVLPPHGGKYPLIAEHSVHYRERHAYDCEIIALNLFDEHTERALYAVGACLIERFA